MASFVVAILVPRIPEGRPFLRNPNTVRRVSWTWVYSNMGTLRATRIRRKIKRKWALFMGHRKGSTMCHVGVCIGKVCRAQGSTEGFPRRGMSMGHAMLWGSARFAPGVLPVLASRSLPCKNLTCNPMLEQTDSSVESSFISPGPCEGLHTVTIQTPC